MKNAAKRRKLTPGSAITDGFNSGPQKKSGSTAAVVVEDLLEMDVEDDDEEASFDDGSIAKKTKYGKRHITTTADQDVVVGDVVFARLSPRAPWWPAVIIDPQMCGYQMNDKTWVYWLGDNRISDVDPIQVKLLPDGFSHCFRGGGTQNYVASINKAIELHANRHGIAIEDDPVEWAMNNLSTSKPSKRRKLANVSSSSSLDSDEASSNSNVGETLLPDFIKHRLSAIKKQQSRKLRNESLIGDPNDVYSMKKLNNTCADEDDENSDSSTSGSNGGGSMETPAKSRFADADREARRLAVSKMSLNDFCIACGTDDNLKAEHPLVEGRFCKTCTSCYKEVCFVYDEDNKKEYCSICGGGGDLFICDNSNCANVFCHDCVTVLDSEQSLKTILEINPWFCYICNQKPIGKIRPRADWESRVFALFKTANVLDDIDLSWIPSEKRSVRVLSLFDGVGTAKLVCDELGLDIGAYYSSEIDPEAMLVTKVNHSNQITYLGDVREVDLEKLKEIGPIDVVVGGSPCNDISIANPKRKGLYDPTGTGILFFEFYRILQTLLQLNSRQKRNTFWLFENVASMRMEYRSVIDRFLGRVPALYDSCYFSAQNRARYFWGNIPGMYNATTPPLTQQSPRVNDILVPHCGRVAKMDKVRTVTTRTNSLKQGRSFSVCPVEMDGKPDTLWPTELETLFGLPRHYTDVGSLSPTKRQKLIGQGWTVPVVKHILRPLQRFFKTKDTK